MSKQKSKRKKERPVAPPFKIIVEKHADGYVAYPLGMKGVVVGEGETYEAALGGNKEAQSFKFKKLGKVVMNAESPVLEAFVAEAEVSA
jgi:hypothetical protein